MVRNFNSIQQASQATAGYIIETARSAIKRRGLATIVLAGGSTPGLTYKILSAPEQAAQLLWPKCHLFWGDERWVPANHSASNYAMAERLLLSQIKIPARNIHRIKTEYESPQTTAAEYEKHLKDFFQAQKPAGKSNPDYESALPKFDLILLGMGADGHTASLFPGTLLLQEKKRWVAAVPTVTGIPPVPRITLTPALINQARNILFLIAGSEKTKILDQILSHPVEAKNKYPAAWIRPAGNLVWLVAKNN